MSDDEDWRLHGLEGEKGGGEEEEVGRALKGVGGQDESRSSPNTGLPGGEGRGRGTSDTYTHTHVSHRHHHHHLLVECVRVRVRICARVFAWGARQRRRCRLLGNGGLFGRAVCLFQVRHVKRCYGWMDGWMGE